MTTTIDVVDHIEEKRIEAEKANDLKALDALKKYFKHADEPSPAPFMPTIELKESRGTSEGSFAISLGNRIEKSRRKVRYRKRLVNGDYHGPFIVSEGDSWFQYPFFLTDIIDVVSEKFAVRSLGGAGHHFHDMVRENEYGRFIDSETDFLLISGGGNDLLAGGNLINLLRFYQGGMTAEEVIDAQAFRQFLDRMLRLYRNMASPLLRDFSQLRILGHGYDRALARRGGPWLGKPLASRGVPEPLWNEVVGHIMDGFNEIMQQLARDFPGKFHYVDCRGLVGDNPNSWHDEIHPRNSGYKRCAEAFVDKINELGILRDRTFWLMDRPTGPLLGNNEMLDPNFAAPTNEAIISGLGRASVPLRHHQALTNGHSEATDALSRWRARLDEVDREAYQHYLELEQEKQQPECPERMRNREGMLPRSDIFSIERIIGDNNLFQVNYLSRGRSAARSVGRISVVNSYGIPRGYGSGFLVAPGLLLTNHHVLKDRSLIENSYLLMDYEYDEENGLCQTERFEFTDDIFVTNANLDFTFVSVASKSRLGKSLQEYGHLRLIKETGKAIKHEPMSVIQHANGLPKQIAMRDSVVLGRKSDFIYYTTDTNSGSSGSPVLNDQWFPVGLHHRAVPDFNRPNSFVCNRGIRISSIINYLESVGRDPQAREILTRVLPRERLSGSFFLGEDGEELDSLERMREPYHDAEYHNRDGYDPEFLGARVPLPRVRDRRRVAKMRGSNDHVIPYEHFSVVMFKSRRLALFTAANVRADERSKRPDPSKRYTRRALSGLGRNDREKWFEDPRLSPKHQLPDRFFTKDGGAFDKGHVVRRDDVAWGSSYAEVRRANGDTYHTTNCSPQVKDFNRSSSGGIWGKLENLVLEQARSERYCVFAGPVFDVGDRSFRGFDDQGRVSVQIPQKYWKVVVARNGDDLQTYAFLLEQDLSDVPLEEFSVGEFWRSKMVTIPILESLVQHFTFPEELHHSDQARTGHGELLRESLMIELRD